MQNCMFKSKMRLMVRKIVTLFRKVITNLLDERQSSLQCLAWGFLLLDSVSRHFPSRFGGVTGGKFACTGRLLQSVVCVCAADAMANAVSKGLDALVLSPCANKTAHCVSCLCCRRTPLWRGTLRATETQ